MSPLEPALFDQSLDGLAHSHSRDAPARGKLALARQALAHIGGIDQLEQADTQLMGLRARATSKAVSQHQLGLASSVRGRRGGRRPSPPGPLWSGSSQSGYGVYRPSYAAEQPRRRTNWTS